MLLDIPQRKCACFRIVGNRRCNSQLMVNNNLDICIIESDVRRFRTQLRWGISHSYSFPSDDSLSTKLIKYPVCAVDKHVSSLPNSVSRYFGTYMQYFNANISKSMFLGEEQIETLIYINEREGYCVQRCVPIQLLPRTPRMVHLALSPSRFVSFMVSHVVF